jgi:hypothetical protein
MLNAKTKAYHNKPMETDLLVSLGGRNARLAHAVQKKCTSSRDFFLENVL